MIIFICLYYRLPILINGSRAILVSNKTCRARSNRRELWWGTDMAGAGAKRAAWNAALLSGGVAPAYLRLLSAAAQVLSQPTDHQLRT